MKYNFIVYLDNEVKISLPVEYENESEYLLRKDVTGIGTNGVWQKFDNEYSYIPAHRITKIDVIVDNK